jgi:hypothetical protein
LGVEIVSGISVKLAVRVLLVVVVRVMDGEALLASPDQLVKVYPGLVAAVRVTWDP